MQQNQLELIQLLQTSYISQNNQERTLASQKLQQLTNQNPALFIMTCSQFLSENQNDIHTSLLILTALRSFLKPSDSSPWYTLNDEQKSNLKMTCFTLLVSPEEGIKNASAYLLSNIFVLNLQNKEETKEMLQNIVNNTNFNDLNIQKSAIMTLSNICELLPLDKIHNLTDEQVEEILFGLFQGLSQYSPLTQTSLKGLSHAIEFVKPKMQQEKIADFIMEKLLKIIQEAKDKQDEDVLYLSINCLNELSVSIYQNFDKYNLFAQQKIYECKDIKITKVQNALQQFFIDLLKQESIYKKNLFKETYQILATYCVDYFKELYIDEEVDEQNSLLTSTLEMLKLINKIYFENTFQFLFDFVVNNFQQVEPQKSQSIFVLNSLMILELKDNQDIKNWINKIFSILISSMGTYQNLVEEHTNFIFIVEAAKIHYDVFLQPQNFVKVIQKVFSFYSNDNHPKLQICRKYSLQMLSNLINAIPINNKDFIDKLNSYAPALMDKILISLQNEQVISNIHDCYYMMYNLISKAVDKKVHSTIYKKFLSNFLNTMNNENDKEKKIFKCNMDFIILSYLLGQVLNETYDYLQDIKKEDFQQTFDQIHLLFQQYQEIQNEGFYFMTLIVSIYKDSFQDKVPLVFEYIQHSLTDIQNQELYKTGLECLNLLIQSHREEIKNLVMQKIGDFINQTMNPEVDDELTLRLICCLQNLAFNYPEITVNYLDKIHQKLKYISYSKI